MSWGMVGAAAVTVVGGYLSSKKKGSGSSGSSSSTSVYDPYAQYRPQAASQLNQLMTDPNYLQTLPEYQAQLQAASRTMAAQGYTGSGNALVAAAQAGGNAYQQAFNNLALLSGAGQSPAAAQSAANQQANYQQGQNNQMWGQIGNIAGQVINNSGSGGGQQIAPIDNVDYIGSYQPDYSQTFDKISTTSDF